MEQANIKSVLQMAQRRIYNSLLDSDNKVKEVIISNNKIILLLSNGRNFELSESEIKHQAIEFVEEIF